MAESPAADSSQPPVTRPSKPLSEGLLNEKWDRCLSNMLVKSGLYASVGIVFSVLLFRRRPWPAFVGLGLGAGRAWEECDNSFKNAAARSRDASGLRVMKP